ncbi:MAG: acyl-CoA dehydrogenase family protein [Rhodocyclaceae bacterium]|nr:acyl-CoA dehydrogenase family protein [Rhodocyclaceae bacterium]MBK9624442.1 acyl-CoA dehydrogenase family protein [Rhodocyclaceae bacterium]MBP6109871.1 acyl-CoA dehydrogenase family protein [Rhodocyclaceae bacterium]MBP6279902.1 acyl-CoA dehydrogenase family protein [Rhodocyclaceae bacterium]
MSFEFPDHPNYLSHEHIAFRDSLRAFVASEITPNVEAWDEAGRFPRELYARAANVGLLGMGYPEIYGGTPCDEFFKIVANEEISRAGCGGLSASLMSHGIALPPIVARGNAELKQRVIPAVLAGDKIAALCITEPSGGSDVANLRTTAVRDGNHYLVNGEKTFITSGMRADFLTVAVRTSPENKGAGGISLLLIEGNTPGLTRTELKKMGWWASDTAQLHFDNCRVPVENLVGQENQGFKAIMSNFNSERLGMAVMAYSYAKVCLDEALDWARERKTFGMALSERQVIRHKLVDMAMRIDASRTLAYELAFCVENKIGDPNQLVARLCMLKNLATQTMQFCADQSVQILGGMGFMRGTKSERIYREVKVMMIGGGAEEIMKDLAARQLGI